MQLHCFVSYHWSLDTGEQQFPLRCLPLEEVVDCKEITPQPSLLQDEQDK